MDMSLGSLITMNTANAQSEGGGNYFSSVDDCTFVEMDPSGWWHFYSGQELRCNAGLESCIVIPCAKDIEVNP